MTVSKKKIGVAVAVAAVALAGIGGVAIAKSDRDHDHHRDFAGRGESMHFGGNMLRMARALDLNDDQREQARALANDLRDHRRERREAARLAASAIFTQESLSPDDAAKLLAMREQNRDQTRAFIGEKLSEFHAILTPAQRERVVALMTERRGGFGFHRGKHRDGKHRWRRDDDDHDDDDDRH